MLSRCHTLVRATKSPSQGGAFSDQRCGWSLWQIYGMPYKKNTEVEVLQVGDLSKGSAIFFFFWWEVQCNTGVCSLVEAELAFRRETKTRRVKDKQSIYGRAQETI